MILPVLGWKEEADLPDWGVFGLRVKLDTGARTSAVHVRHMEVIGRHHRGGQRLPVLRLVIPLSRVHHGRHVLVDAPVVGYKNVRDTSAKAERRPVVRTRLVCGPLDREIDVTVTDRSGMIFRMILGRQALAGQVLVDAGRGYTTRAAAATRKARR
ncbi:MAG: ATP-dependent zinc protease [Euzebyales bacterium]|nr:ATP-dependent zinc protease [Euzebyales bacterium]